MKKLTLILALTISAFTFKAQINVVAGGPVAAAVANPWQDAVLRADGLTEVEGVEAYSMRTTCGNQDVVLIKFVNKNNYKVRVEWKDAIKTPSGWVYSNVQTPKSLYLEPGNTVVGQCNGLDKLKVGVNTVINNPQDFGPFSVSGLATFKLTQAQTK